MLTSDGASRYPVGIVKPDGNVNKILPSSGILFEVVKKIVMEEVSPAILLLRFCTLIAQKM